VYNTRKSRLSPTEREGSSDFIPEQQPTLEENQQLQEDPAMSTSSLNELTQLVDKLEQQVNRIKRNEEYVEHDVFILQQQASKATKNNTLLQLSVEQV